MARRSDDQSRTEVIGVRLTRAERVRLEHRAAAAGFTVSAFAAQMLTRGQVTVESRPRAFMLPPELVAEFKRIGNNLNQIAHALNSRKGVRDGAVAAEFRDFILALAKDRDLAPRARTHAARLVKSGRLDR